MASRVPYPHMALRVPYPQFGLEQISRSPLVAELGPDDRAGFILESASSGRYWHATSSIRRCLYGEVFRAVEVCRSPIFGTWECRGSFAIKKMSLQMIAMQVGVSEDPVKEVATLQYIRNNGSHPNIIEITEALQDQDYIFVVLPYCHGGELFDLVKSRKKLTESSARLVFRDILAGVSFLHSTGLCHRDMSLENVLLDESGEAKIIDFGMALMVGQPQDHRQNDLAAQGSVARSDRRNIQPTGPCGKKRYMAPEVAINETPFDGLAVDVWACGVMLFIMLVGFHPFDVPIPAQDERCRLIAVEGRLHDLIRAWELPISAEAACLIQSCLIFNPSNRPTAKDLLEHPWLQF